MEKILNKALSEVLTPLYSEQLRDAFDTGYKFSPEFENKMRELIRKTDRPVTKYIGYMAAAACAVIGIGSAIIIPTLMNVNIDTQQPENTSVSVEATVPKPLDTSSSTTTPTIASASTSDSGADEENIIIDDFDDKEDTVVISDVTTDTTEPDTDSIHEVSDTADSGGQESLVVSDEHEESEGDDAAVAVDNSDDDCEIDDSYEESECDIVDEAASDDAVIWNDESDYDIADTTGDYEIAETFGMEVKAGDKLGDVMAKVIPDFSYEKLWATSGEYSVDGSFSRANNITEYLNFHRCEYGFIQDVVHKLGEAVSTDSSTDIQTAGQPGISLWLSGNKITVRPLGGYPQNPSAWKNYIEYFGIGEDEYSSEIETYEDEVEPLDDYSNIETVKIYRNGVVETKGSYVITNTDENKNYLCKLSNNRFILDSKTVEELFAHIDSMHISSGLSTVGDVSSSVGITSDNIESAAVRIDYMYDTLIQDNKISSSYIEKFLASHANDKVYPTRWTDSEGMDNMIEMNGVIEIELYTKNCAHIKMYIDTDASFFSLDSEFVCFIGDNFGGYYFNITQQDIEDMLKAISESNNYTIPIYHTLSEYLADKNFKTLTEVSYSCKKDGQQGWYKVTDKNDLQKIRDFLNDEFRQSSYLYNHRYNRFQSEIKVTVKGYLNYIEFDEDDTVTVRAGYFRNKFKLSDGFYEKLAGLIKECESAVFEQSLIEEDYEQVVDDDDVDEVAEDFDD